MASIIIFGSLWGIFLKEWKDTGGLSKFLLGVALVTLIVSTIVIGYGNLLGLQLGGHRGTEASLISCHPVALWGGSGLYQCRRSSCFSLHIPGKTHATQRS